MHRCPAKGCPRDVDNTKLMCAHHWAIVPVDLQRRIMAAYVPGQISRQYAEAVKLAVKAVERVEPAQPGLF